MGAYPSVPHPLDFARVPGFRCVELFEIRFETLFASGFENVAMPHQDQICLPLGR